MMLKDNVVVWERIDIRQSRALGEKIANGDFVCSFNSRDEGTYVLIQPHRAIVYHPQNGGRRELHRNGSNVEPRCRGVSNAPFAIGEAIRLLENNPSIPFNANIPGKVSALNVRLKIYINSCRIKIALRWACTSTEENNYDDCEQLHGHGIPRSSVTQLILLLPNAGLGSQNSSHRKLRFPRRK
jgi:hypothetical protein